MKHKLKIKKKTSRQDKRALRRQRRKWRTPRSPNRDKEEMRTPENSQKKRRCSSKVYTSNQEKGAQEARKESQGRSCGEMQHDAWEEDSENKALDEVAYQRQIHGRQRRIE